MINIYTLRYILECISNFGDYLHSRLLDFWLFACMLISMKIYKQKYILDTISKVPQDHSSQIFELISRLRKIFKLDHDFDDHSSDLGHNCAARQGQPRSRVWCRFQCRHLIPGSVMITMVTWDGWMLSTIPSTWWSKHVYLCVHLTFGTLPVVQYLK